MLNTETKKAYIITDEQIVEWISDPKANKQISELIIAGSADATSFAEGKEGRSRHVYQVVNLAKVKKQEKPYFYYVEIFINSVGDRVATCECPARKVCKHIIRAAVNQSVIRQVEKDYGDIDV